MDQWSIAATRPFESGRGLVAGDGQGRTPGMSGTLGRLLPFLVDSLCEQPRTGGEQNRDDHQADEADFVGSRHTLRQAINVTGD